MGKDFAGEITKLYYEKSKWSVEHCDLLRPFLLQRLRQPGLVQDPFRYIRRLNLQIELADSAPKSRYRKEADNVGACQLIMQVTCLKLRLVVNIQPESAAEKFEEALMPVIYDLKALGASVTIECRYWSWPPSEIIPEFDYDQPRSE